MALVPEMRKNLRILLTTVSGQDSTIFSKLAHERQHVLFGLNHRAGKSVLSPYYNSIYNMDFKDSNKLAKIILESEIDVIVNTAALSSVHKSFEHPSDYMETNYWAVLRLLKILENHRYGGDFLQFGSTDMFGTEIVSANQGQLFPWSPYGESKAEAFKAVRSFRMNQGMKFSNIILTNHDSNFRPDHYVIKFIANQFVSMISEGDTNITLQDPSIIRDWASAEDLMSGVLNYIELGHVGDFSFATGCSLSLKDLIFEVADGFKLEVSLEVQGSPNTRFRQAKRILVDTSDTERELNWRASFKRGDTLNYMIREKLRSK